MVSSAAIIKIIIISMIITIMIVYMKSIIMIIVMMIRTFQEGSSYGQPPQLTHCCTLCLCTPDQPEKMIRRMIMVMIMIMVMMTMMMIIFAR